MRKMNYKVDESFERFLKLFFYTKKIFFLWMEILLESQIIKLGDLRRHMMISICYEKKKLSCKIISHVSWNVNERRQDAKTCDEWGNFTPKKSSKKVKMTSMKCAEVAHLKSKFTSSTCGQIKSKSNPWKIKNLSNSSSALKTWEKKVILKMK